MGESGRTRQVSEALRGARELLGVTDGADVGELTRAYRRAARDLHPDLSSDPEATQQFQALLTAYQLAVEAALQDTAPATDPDPAVNDSGPRHEPNADIGASPPTRDRVTLGTDAGARMSARGDGVWVVAGPVHVEPARHHDQHTDTTGDRWEGRP
jgi:DnaJ-like protein